MSFKASAMICSVSATCYASNQQFKVVSKEIPDNRELQGFQHLRIRIRISGQPECSH
jgi:hypothetical protein